MDKKQFKEKVLNSVEVKDLNEDLRNEANNKKYNMIKYKAPSFIFKGAFFLVMFLLVGLTCYAIILEAGSHNACGNEENIEFTGDINYIGEKVNNSYVTYMIYRESNDFNKEYMMIKENYNISLANLVNDIYFRLLKKPKEEVISEMKEIYSADIIEQIVINVDQAMHEDNFKHFDKD